MKFKVLTETETSNHLMLHTSFCVNVDLINQMAYDVLNDHYNEYLNNFRSKFLIFNRTPKDFDTFITGSMAHYAFVQVLRGKPYIGHTYNYQVSAKHHPKLSTKEKDLLAIAAKYARTRFLYDKYINRIKKYAEYPYQLHEEDIKNFEYFDESNNEIVEFVKNYNTP